MNFYDNQSFMSQADGFLKAVSAPCLARDIIIYLNSHPMGEYTPLQLSEQLSADYDEVTKILKKLSESKNLKSIPLTNQAKARSMKEAMQTTAYALTSESMELFQAFDKIANLQKQIRESLSMTETDELIKNLRELKESLEGLLTDPENLELKQLLFKDGISLYDLSFGYNNGIYNRLKNRIDSFATNIHDLNMQVFRLETDANTTGDLNQELFKLRDVVKEVLDKVESKIPEVLDAIFALEESQTKIGPKLFYQPLADELLAFNATKSSDELSDIMAGNIADIAQSERDGSGLYASLLDRLSDMFFALIDLISQNREIQVSKERAERFLAQAQSFQAGMTAQEMALLFDQYEGTPVYHHWFMSKHANYSLDDEKIHYNFTPKERKRAEVKLARSMELTDKEKAELATEQERHAAEKAKQAQLGQNLINKPLTNLTDEEFAFLQKLLGQSHFDYRFSADGDLLSASATTGDYLLIKQFQTENMTIESPKQSLILCNCRLEVKSRWQK